MKLKSDQKRKLVLKVAKEEFLMHGFKDSSLRVIAKKANCTTGTIYIYFKNKDEIFRELVNPVIVWFENRFKIVKNATNKEIKEGLGSLAINYELWKEKGFLLFVDLTDKFRDELKLLFFKSSGSEMQNFKEKLIEDAMQRGLKIFYNMERSEYFAGKKISEFFIRNFAIFHISLMQEMIKQNKSKEEMIKMGDEFSMYTYNGWKALVKM